MNYCRQSPQFEYRHYVYPISKPVITSDQIINLVCREFDVTPKELKNNSLLPKFKYPRKVAIKLMMRFTNLSLTRIGLFFNQAHCTVIYTRDNFEKTFWKHPDLKRRYFLLVSMLEALK